MKPQIKNKKNRRISLYNYLPIPTQWIFMGDKLSWAKNIWGGYSKWEDFWSDHAKLGEEFYERIYIA